MDTICCFYIILQSLFCMSTDQESRVAKTSDQTFKRSQEECVRGHHKFQLKITHLHFLNKVEQIFPFLYVEYLSSCKVVYVYFDIENINYETAGNCREVVLKKICFFALHPPSMLM